MRTRRALRVGLVAALCLALLTAAWLYVQFFYDLPSYAEFETSTVSERAPLADIPDALRWATLARNDPYFYTRPGIDLRDLPRAIWRTWRYGYQGGDDTSIVELLARNLMQASGKRVGSFRWQRTRELILMTTLSRRYSRDEILEMYLNSAPYGQGVYGVGAAAQHYYDKHVRDLNLAESAMLVSIADFWSYANLSQERDAFEQHQKDVLTVMVWEGYISREEAELAAEDVVYFVQDRVE